ncbi:MAG: hypothetical protein WCQ67_01610 [Treponema sp.]
MQKKIKLLSITICLFLQAASIFAEGDCYTYDRWSEVEYSPDAYSVANVYSSSELGGELKLQSPQGIFCKGTDVYICDTGNNRIIQMEYSKDRTLTVKRIIESFNLNDDKASVKNTFSSPYDVYVSAEDYIYVADMDNGRVVKLDKDLNYMMQFVMPNDPTYDSSLSFMPTKVIADVSGRVYAIAKNVNKGFLKYESDGTFAGFYGASEVTPNALDELWKKLSTRRQREQLESFVPTEYSNVYKDSEGFLYASLKTFDEWNLASDKAKPIRRLNALGNDILIKNAKNPPIGDLIWSKSGTGYDGPSRFEDITVLTNDVYIALDGTRGRIFGYNNQGYLLFAFGGKGNQKGFFKQPIAIEHIERDLFIVDSSECTVTVMTPTNYCNLIYDALEKYADGKYEESASIWEKVLQLNGNYDLAYIGLGKSELRQNHYKAAMDYFEVKRDKKEYSKAFVLYRKEWFEKNIWWIFTILIVIVAIVFIVKQIKKIRREVESL